MAMKNHHKFNDITNLLGDGKTLGNKGDSISRYFQLSLLKIVFTDMYTKSLHDGTHTFALGDSKKAHDSAETHVISRQQMQVMRTSKYYFTTELKRIQDVISVKSTNEAKVKAFVDVVKAMNIPKEIKYHCNDGSAIKIEPSIDGGIDNNKFSLFIR